MWRLLSSAMLLAAGPLQLTAQRAAPAGQQVLWRSPDLRSEVNNIAASMRRAMSRGERGALVGGLIGFGAGIALGLTVERLDSRHVRLSHLLLSGVILALPGIVIGGLIGNASGKK